jgi:hypothetical protein
MARKIKETKVECFICDKSLDNWDYETHNGEKITVHPMSGLHFRTYGHYGSAIFDPMDDSSIDIAICDECVESRKNKIYGYNEFTRQE